MVPLARALDPRAGARLPVGARGIVTTRLTWGVRVGRLPPRGCSAPWPELGASICGRCLPFTCALPPQICALRSHPLHGVEHGRRRLKGEHTATGRIGRCWWPPLPPLAPLCGGHRRGQQPAPLPDSDRPVGLRWPYYGLIAHGGDDVFLQEFRAKALSEYASGQFWRHCLGVVFLPLRRCCYVFCKDQQFIG